jgi:hypothetical protein
MESSAAPSGRVGWQEEAVGQTVTTKEASVLAAALQGVGVERALMQVAVQGACVGVTGRVMWRSEGCAGVRLSRYCVFAWRAQLR